MAIVDAADVPIVKNYNWCAAAVGKHGHVYAVSYINGRLVRMHRLLMKAAPNTQIDHADMNTLNNCRTNLRPCTKSLNMANKRVRKDSATGVKGVFLHPSTGRYRAKIKFNNKQIHIGYFDTLADAATAYATKANELFGQFARSD